jgi:hypothetical protein
MNRLPILLASCLLLSPLAAQAPDEAKFLGEAAKRLNAFATLCFKSHYPRRAKEIWHEVIAEYDTNDAVARKALGYVQVGTSWAPDPAFTFPDQDQPDAAVALQLNKRWTAVAAELGKEHLELAEQLGAGNAERANWHRQRAARFAPGDKKIASALGLKSEGGIVGSDVELTLLRRTRLIDKEITTQLARTPKVEPVPGYAHPYLKAGPAVRAVRGPIYTIAGDFDEAVLAEAARHADRAHAFCEAALAGYEGFGKTLGVKTFVFYRSKDTWAQVLKANASLLSGGRLEFLLENDISATVLGGGDKGIWLAANDSDALVYDRTVRWVVQQYSGLRTDGMSEGIGHAAVGLFFGRSLTYAVGQPRQGPGTVAGGQRKQRVLMPDMTSWAELVVEAAWEKTSAPAAALPLVKAAEFTTDERVKSWSFCDYLLRRDPALLLALDQTAGSGAKTQSQVSAKFAERTKGLQLEKVEEDWRRFWTEDTPILRAVRNKKAPLEGVSLTVPEWLEEFNKLRQAQKPSLPPVGWSEAWSTECRQHVEYLKANSSQRGPAKEHTQELKLKGASNAGRTFAQQSLVSAGEKDPKKAMARWLDWPGYRDAVLNPNLDTIGLYADAGLMVMDVSRGVLDSAGLRSAQYPGPGQQGVPVEVDVKELGPEVEALLARDGKAGVKTLGYPISVHTFRGSVREATAVSCELRVGKDLVEGVLHFASGGGRRACAPGLIVFYPLAPLRRGMLHHVQWTGIGGPGGIKYEFTTQ